ncbi:iron chelate uptake ABC transporter family permease subunit, partial [Aeromicrobium sp.]|uniref:iron chelate uptake ABC transporter family permease subunit n=1 Tax=Aeromicrobium sp. TaxID=1871063 RepID=UPI0028AA985B
TSLGVRAGRTERAALCVAVVVASVVTAVAGPIGFVAFVAPQAALRLFRTAGPTPFAAGLVGAAMLVLSDLVAQHLLFPLPVGVVTSVVGAPCLLLLIITHLRRSSV